MNQIRACKFVGGTNAGIQTVDVNQPIVKRHKLINAKDIDFSNLSADVRDEACDVETYERIRWQENYNVWYEYHLIDK